MCFRVRLRGGLEIALATHHRIVVDDPKAVVGFPEVQLGLLPGGGGVVRTVRLLGIVPIRDSWRGIFSNAKIRVQAESVTHWQGSVLAIHHLTEILFVGDDPSPHGPLHVTHIYARGAHGWRLVSRHASAADDSHQAMAEAVPHTLH